MNDSNTDCHAVLGLSKDANADEARAAFRRLAKQYHPDAAKGDADQFHIISQAYDSYCQSAAAPVPLPARRTLVSSFWKTARQVAPAPLNGANIHADLRLSLEDSLKGAARRVTLEDGRALDVQCPPGCVSGDIIRLKGAGEPGQFGGNNGDALIRIALMEHKRASLSGRDLHLPLWLDLHQLRAGSRVEMRTPHGPLRVKVPPLSSNGQTLRLKDLGLPANRSKPAGHLFVTLKARRSPSFSDALGRFSRIWANPLRPTT